MGPHSDFLLGASELEVGIYVCIELNYVYVFFVCVLLQSL